MSTEHAGRPEEIDPDTVKIEVNIDDADGELLGYVMEKLFAAGARDVYYAPIYMKKNRPAVMLQLLCSAAEVQAMTRLIFEQTTTLGVRYYPLTVHRLERRFRSLSTRFGDISIKEGLLGGRVVQRAPEYEDCRSAAERHGVPLKEVFREVWGLLSSPYEDS